MSHIISSRTGEFETGYEKGRQTREHAMLVRTCGVKQMICVINKMDDSNWDKGAMMKFWEAAPLLEGQRLRRENGNLVFVPTSGEGLELGQRRQPTAPGTQGLL